MTLAIGNVTDLAGVTKFVVGELAVQRVEGPSGEVVAEKPKDSEKAVLRGESTTGHRMDVCPIHDRVYKGEVACNQRNVPKRAESTVGAPTSRPRATPRWRTFGPISSRLSAASWWSCSGVRPFTYPVWATMTRDPKA